MTLGLLLKHVWGGVAMAGACVIRCFGFETLKNVAQVFCSVCTGGVRVGEMTLFRCSTPVPFAFAVAALASKPPF